MAGRLYSVGKEIISMDWVELSLTVLSKTRDSALAEVIIVIVITVFIINVNVPIIRAVSASALAVIRTPGPEVTPAFSSSPATFTAFQKTSNHQHHYHYQYYCHYQVDQVHKAGARLQHVQPRPHPSHPRHRQPGSGTRGDDSDHWSWS